MVIVLLAAAGASWTGSTVIVTESVDVVGLADSVDSAYKIIKSQKPDLVFLDKPGCEL